MNNTPHATRQRHPVARFLLGNLLPGLALLLLMGYGVRFLGAGLRNTSHVTGWILLGTLFLLTLHGPRKKLTVLPLGAMHLWTGLHLLTGFVVIPLFAFHVGKWIPNGFLDTLLTLCFWLVALSGVVGFLLYRGVPKRLTRRGVEVILERIPGEREAIRREVEQAVITLAATTGSTTLAEFHACRLHPFLSKPCNIHEHLLDLHRSRFTLVNEIKGLERYLDAREMAVLRRIETLVLRKDDLDHHCTLQGLLKAWLLVHLPLTSGLWILVIWHMLNVLGFQG
ncbi:MAG: hypothetical protein HQL66_07455 [Magnetococcales bacterium]|nr:hypothetical protein [Magnetococcales bacterium]